MSTIKFKATVVLQCQYHSGNVLDLHFEISRTVPRVHNT